MIGVRVCHWTAKGYHLPLSQGADPKIFEEKLRPCRLLQELLQRSAVARLTMAKVLPKAKVMPKVMVLLLAMMLLFPPLVATVELWSYVQ